MSFGCAYLETSTFQGDNIEKGFEMMTPEIHKKYRNENIIDDELLNMEKGEDINLNKKEDEKKKGCCSEYIIFKNNNIEQLLIF